MRTWLVVATIEIAVIGRWQRDTPLVILERRLRLHLFDGFWACVA